MLSLRDLLRRSRSAERGDNDSRATTRQCSGWWLGLAALTLAASVAGGQAAQAATTVPIASGLTSPNGQVWIGNHLWVSDEGQGFCRMDAVPGSTTFAINPATCNSLTNDPGEVAFDPATNSVYLPDKGGQSQGVWRLKFDPATETVSSPVLLAPNAKLGRNRPAAVALGPDGSLYVSFQDRGNVVRITTPASAVQSVQSVGQSLDKQGVRSLAFVGGDLYLSETRAATRIANAAACTGGCKAADAGIGFVEPRALASDGSFLYMGNNTAVSRLNVSTGILEPFGAGFNNIRGLAVSPLHALYVSDDPGLGVLPLMGRMFNVLP